MWNEHFQSYKKEITLKIQNVDESFLSHQDLLTAYRYSRILLTAHHLGIFESLGYDGHPSSSICMKTGMDHDYGSRFLYTLAAMGLLENRSGLYSLSEYSKKYLLKNSAMYQGASLDFEHRLQESWQVLEKTLITGKRVFGIKEKQQDVYERDLDKYLKAMDNAALIRASELWDAFQPEGKSGLIIDVGAGSGAFLMEFLGRYSLWRGVFCDLPDVISRAMINPKLQSMMGRMEFRSCNLLDQEQIEQVLHSFSADIILVSNLIHCQGIRETENLLSMIAPCLAIDGKLVIHDFMTDNGVRGAAYDLHMMLNTLNGRTYSSSELVRMLEPLGLREYYKINHPSASSSMVFFKGDKA